MVPSLQDHFSTPMSTRLLLLRIWRQLSRKRRFQLCSVLLLMLMSGFAEVLSLAAVVPFLTMLSDSQPFTRFPIFRSFFVALGVTSREELLIATTFLFALAAILSASVRLVNLKANLWLGAVIGSDVSCEAYRNTLYQPYTVHVRRNSSEVITAIANQTSLTIQVLIAMLQLVTSFVVALGLVIALLAINWIVACTSISLFGVGYWLLSISSRSRLLANSQIYADSSRLQLKILQEGLGAIRDIILDGSQPSYVALYRKADLLMRLRQAESIFLGAFPRYSLEALGLVLIAMLTLLLSWNGRAGQALVPLLGTLALGSQRLLPALQQIYASWALIKAHQSSVQDVLAMLKHHVPVDMREPSPSPYRLNRAIQVRKLHYRYDDNSPWVLSGIDLDIRRGERIGLIGTTGSGKSTLVDLLMGLLEPTHGQVLIDGANLHGYESKSLLHAWRSAIAHVPQSIFLVDGSIAENIAFGAFGGEINMSQVRYAAQQAQIASFIESCPKSYSTFVGERGVKLSGGQCQRIGLARAFYKKAELIILDEATSALDSDTEADVMESLNCLNRCTTIVMISHRLSTLVSCDRVIKLNDGFVVSDGSPQLAMKGLDSSDLPGS